MADHFTPFAKNVDDEVLAILSRQHAALISLWFVACLLAVLCLGVSIALVIKRAPEIANSIALERPA